MARPAPRKLVGEMATADLDAAEREQVRSSWSISDHEAALSFRRAEMAFAWPTAEEFERRLRDSFARDKLASAVSMEPTPGDADPAAPPAGLALRIAAGLSALALVAVTAATFFAVRL